MVRSCLLRHACGPHPCGGAAWIGTSFYPLGYASSGKLLKNTSAYSPSIGIFQKLSRVN